MLAVDPVKRITVPDIMHTSFFTKDLPRYLQPLPSPGPVLGTLSSLVSPPSRALDYEYIDGLGRIEEDVVQELSDSMEGVTVEDVWEALRAEEGPQGNAVKVAYMLLRDKKRSGPDRECASLGGRFMPILMTLLVAKFEEKERDAQLAAMDVRPTTRLCFFFYLLIGILAYY